MDITFFQTTRWLLPSLLLAMAAMGCDATPHFQIEADNMVQLPANQTAASLNVFTNFQLLNQPAMQQQEVQGVQLLSVQMAWFSLAIDESEQSNLGFLTNANLVLRQNGANVLLGSVNANQIALSVNNGQPFTTSLGKSDELIGYMVRTHQPIDILLQTELGQPLAQNSNLQIEVVWAIKIAEFPWALLQLN